MRLLTIFFLLLGSTYITLANNAYYMFPDDDQLPSEAGAGDTVFLEPGNYTKFYTIDWNNRGAEGSPLVIMPTTPNTVFFRGDSTVSFSWTQAGEYWTASTNGLNATMLYCNDEFLEHALTLEDFECKGEGAYFFDATSNLIYFKPNATLISGYNIDATFSIGIRDEVCCSSTWC